MQTSFGVVDLVIVGGRPKVLNLKETLAHFVEHRREVVTRRTRYELKAAEAQLELVEGLGMALTELDLVIATIRAAKDRDVAREALMNLKLQGLEAFVRTRGPPHRRNRRGAQAPRLHPERAPGQRHPRHAPRPTHRPRAREARGGVPTTSPTKSRASAPSSRAARSSSST